MSLMLIVGGLAFAGGLVAGVVVRKIGWINTAKIP